MRPIRLMTVAPGHFHAALVQKRMLPGIDPRCSVYAPLDPDLIAHLDRLVAFNTRRDNPTAWELDVRAGGNYLDRFLTEPSGNTVVLAGRNRPKIDLMRAAVSKGLHVLADKPWVIEAEDIPKLEDVLCDAAARDVLVWDVMTERHEVTNRLQRELVRDPEVFGEWLPGAPTDPTLTLASVHYLKKEVAGRPLLRPWWWFDPAVSGEALTDVGTHLVDLAMWLVLPEQAVDFRRDVTILDANRWPLVLSPEQLTEVTGLATYPPALLDHVDGEQLAYAGNNAVLFTFRGVHVRVTTLWDYESPGGDSHEAVARGTEATVAVRQKAGDVPELFVAATDPANYPLVVKILESKCNDWQTRYPGVQVADQGNELQIKIPEQLRVGHEGHFAEVMKEFVRYYHAPRSVPMWERVNVLTKYFITTQAADLARRKGSTLR